MNQNIPQENSPAGDVSRRSFVGGLLSAAAGYCLLPDHIALAEGEGANFWKPAASPLAKRIVWAPERTYFAYPHSNGFLPDSTFVVVRRKQGSETGAYADADYLTFDPATQTAKQTAHVSGSRMYYSISDHGHMLVTNRTSALLVDLKQNGATRTVYTAPADWQLGDIYDLSPDGSMAVLPAAFRDPAAPSPAPVSSHPASGRKSSSAISRAGPTVRCSTGNGLSTTRIFPLSIRVGWPIAMRVQGCRTASGPGTGARRRKGGCSSIKGRSTVRLLVGHERAVFHKPGEIFVGYHPSKEAGLYEVGFDRVQRLVSPSESYLHCNISRDGRWAVVDSQPVADPETPDPIPWGRGDSSQPELPRRSDMFVINMKTGARQYLYPAAMSSKHPWHLHPHISPDGKWVVFNDYKEKKVAAVEIDQEALKTFLA